MNVKFFHLNHRPWIFAGLLIFFFCGSKLSAQFIALSQKKTKSLKYLYMFNPTQKKRPWVGSYKARVKPASISELDELWSLSFVENPIKEKAMKKTSILSLKHLLHGSYLINVIPPKSIKWNEKVDAVKK